MAKRKKDPFDPKNIKAPPYALTGSEEHTVEGYIRLLSKRAMESELSAKEKDPSAPPPFYYRLHK